MAVTGRTRRGGVIVAATAVLVALVTACGSDDSSGEAPTGVVTSAAAGAPTTATAFRYGDGECPPDEVDEPVRAFDDAPQQCIDPELAYTATFITSEGEFTVELDTAATPGTTNNFVTLARYRYYDDTPIFRAEPGSGLWQAGGEDNGSSPGYTIPDEGTGFQYPPGTLAMARTGEPNSAGAQFFFVTNERGAYLGEYGTYVVFGTISEGLDVAEAITAAGGGDGVPTKELTIETIEITEA